MYCDDCKHYEEHKEHEMHMKSKMSKETPLPILPQDLELATAYVVYQKYGPLYKLKEGFDKGTIFPELYRPYPGTYEFPADRAYPRKK